MPRAPFRKAKSTVPELEQYLQPTWFLDCDNPDVAARAAEVTAGAADDVERAVRLFYAVRDGLWYDPYSITSEPGDYRASAVLRRQAAYCIPKAVLLTALARAAGIPARLGFADVRNHLASEKLLARLGTDLFVYHGYTEFWLAGRWVKATPAFNIELCERFGVQPLDFDGKSDALFHEYSADGRRHMEYVADRGTFADLPLDEIVRAFEEHYGDFTAHAGQESDEYFHRRGGESDPGQQDSLIDLPAVRVSRWTLARGRSTGHHRHEHDYVVVPVTGGVLNVVDASGARKTMHQVAGEPYAGSAGVEHEVVGADDGDVVFVEVEILKA